MPHPLIVIHPKQLERMGYLTLILTVSIDDKVPIYICTNRQCQQPTTDFQKIEDLLK
jgi:uncharacterized protein YyaL (SSP411 family)